MDNPIELAEQIKDKIYDLPEAKEYLRLKKIIDEDEEINKLQKEIILLRSNGKAEEANALTNKLNAMPIIVNFEAVRAQLADTLKVISNILK